MPVPTENPPVDTSQADGRRRVPLIAALAVLVVYAHLTLEWGFFFSKPSLLSATSLTDALLVLICAPLLPALGLGLASLLGALVGALIGLPLGRARPGATLVARLVPAAGVALAVIMLLDNFTYTLFDFGIKTVGDGPARLAYAAGGVLLVIGAWRALARGEQRALAGRGARAIRNASVFLLLISGLGAAARLGLLPAGSPAASHDPAATTSGTNSSGSTSETDVSRPNILLLGGDGIEAEHASLYGYERDTTPFARDFFADGLVCENAFVNARSTGASLLSLLTGRLPVQTGTHHLPFTLTGDDAYLHLPGVLRGLGYRLVQITARPDADALDANMRRAFHVGNGRPDTSDALGLGAWLGGAFDSEAHFLALIGQRVRVRLGRTVAGEDVADPFEIASKSKRNKQRFYDDGDARVPELIEQLGALPEPFFVHAHLLGTHGARYYLRDDQRAFSSATDDETPFHPDAYDDAIRRFDAWLAEIVAALESTGRLERTIVVFYADHGRTHNVEPRVPLALRFPGGAHGGRIRANTQLVDVAPTLLHALGLPPPAWMAGRSLLAGEPDPRRPVFAVLPSFAMTKRAAALRAEQRMDPTLRDETATGIGAVHVTIGQRWYRVDWEENALTHGEVPGHSAPLPADERLPPAELLDLVDAHLRAADIALDMPDT